MQYQRNDGWIEIVCGSMFSGKTEELLRRIRRAEIAKKRLLVVKPQIDTRFGAERVAAHSNLGSAEAIAVSAPLDIYNLAQEDAEVVAIDEVQFFDWTVADVCTALANEGRRVIAAGLDQDFRGEPFGPMPLLMALAEQVDKLQAICVKCGNAASRTQRLIDHRPARYDDPVILVGGSESYEARCRRCHEVPGKPAPSGIEIASGAVCGQRS